MAAVKYRLPFSGPTGEVALNADYYYVDDYTVGIAQIDAHEIVNASVQWAGVMGSPLTVAAFVDNVLDEEYLTTFAASGIGLGMLSGSYAPPRLYGVRVRYEFGD